MTVEQAINNEAFINEFASFANNVFSHYGGYDDVYEQYNQFSDDEILTLLDHCEKMGLLED
jgi:predicted phosphoribosyltransferase